MFERKKKEGENGSVDRNQLCSFKKNVFHLSSPNHISKRVGETTITRTVSLIETNTKTFSFNSNIKFCYMKRALFDQFDVSNVLMTRGGY